jgi:hypothetical protein
MNVSAIHDELSRSTHTDRSRRTEETDEPPHHQFVQAARVERRASGSALIL